MLSRISKLASELWQDRLENFYGWMFVLPALIGVLIFRAWPMIRAFFLSFTSYSLIFGDANFIGVANYVEMFTSSRFYSSILVTFQYTFMRVIAEVLLALIIALILRKGGPFVKAVRITVFLPVVTSLVAAAVVWKLMYHPIFGIVNGFLNAVGLPTQDFLASVTQALPSLTATVVWKHVGFSVIIFLSGLNAIPRQFYEAAEVDGANKVQQFFHVTLPLIKRTLMYVIVITTIFSFKVLGPVYVMTQGGPRGATRLLVYNIYETGFQAMRLGYASTLSVVMFLILAVFTFFQIRLLRSEVEY